MNRGSERFASSSAAAIARRSSGSRRSSFSSSQWRINQLLFTVSEGEEGDEVPMDDSATPAATHLEFKLGKLVLGHDSRHRKFIIAAHDEESADEAAPTVRVWGDLAQIKSFADEALRVCAAGRPLCPLCGAPMDQSGHVCPRSNGHHEADLDKV